MILEQNKKIIIFGGSGFIGNHLVSYLNSIGCEPIVCDLYNKMFIDGMKFNFETIDVRRSIKTSIVPSEKSIVYNLAAIHKTPGHKPEEYYDTNINGAYNVCNYAREHSIKTIIFFSSISVYGPNELCLNEESNLVPDSDYGHSKLKSEEIHLEWMNESENNQLIILRPGVVYGFNEGGNFTRLYKALNRGVFYYPGRKDTLKACIYVKDLVKISYDLLNDNESDIYNMCYKDPLTIEKICISLCDLLNIEKPTLVIPSKILIFLSNILSFLKINFIGVNADRVRKVMFSTNISGKKVYESGKILTDFNSTISDWYSDCENKGLF